jgi:hypothetical protein
MVPRRICKWDSAIFSARFGNIRSETIELCDFALLREIPYSIPRRLMASRFRGGSRPF